MSEPDKIKGKIEKYLTGTILDVCCGDAKITPEALGVDGRELPGVDFVTTDICNISKQLIPFDTIFSSHTLEHIPIPYAALMDWSKLIKPGGHLILYLPDGTQYSHDDNPEHLWWCEYESFIFFFHRCFCGLGKDFKGNFLPAIFNIVEHGKDFGENRYSFYLVAKKL